MAILQLVRDLFAPAPGVSGNDPLDILTGLKSGDSGARSANSSPRGAMPWVADSFTAGVPIRHAQRVTPADATCTAAD